MSSRRVIITFLRMYSPNSLLPGLADMASSGLCSSQLINRSRYRGSMAASVVMSVDRRRDFLALLMIDDVDDPTALVEHGLALADLPFSTPLEGTGAPQISQ